MHNHASHPPVGMQQNAKLSHPLFSKINANSVTCQAENALPELPNDCLCVCLCMCVCAVSHMLHSYLLGVTLIIHVASYLPVTGCDSPLAVSSLLQCVCVCVCVCVCLSLSLCVPMCKHLRVAARRILLCSPMCVCVCVTDWLSLQPICACRGSLSCSLLPVCNVQLMPASGCRGRST